MHNHEQMKEDYCEGFADGMSVIAGPPQPFNLWHSKGFRDGSEYRRRLVVNVVDGELVASVQSEGNDKSNETT